MSNQAPKEQRCKKSWETEADLASRIASAPGEDMNKGLIFGTCPAKSLEHLPCSLRKDHDGMHQWRTRGESHGTFYDIAHPPVRSVEAFDQPHSINTVSERDLRNYAGWDASDFAHGEAVAMMANEILRLRSQSHPSLQESGPSVFVTSYIAGDKSSVLCRGLHFRAIHDSRAEAERFITLQTHGEPYAITEYVPKSPKSPEPPEPPAGPAFEEFATLAKLAKAIDEADRTNTPQDDWNLRLWRSTATPSVILRLLALAPIDLNATREEGEGWKADVRLGNPVYEVHILTPSGELPIRQNTYKKEDLALASLRMAAPMDRFIRGHVQRVTKGTLTEVLSTICAKDDEIALKYARENKPVPDFVQGIGGKP